MASTNITPQSAQMEEIHAIIDALRLSIEKNEKETRERNRQMDKTEQLIRNLGKHFGSHQRTVSEILEDAVYKKLNKTKTVGGITFNDVAKNARDLKQREYDIVMQNGRYSALIEVKQKAQIKDIQKLLDVQVKAFREGFRLPKTQKIIAGIASPVITDKVKQEAEKKGVVIITQNGDDVTFGNSSGFVPKMY